MAKTKRKYKYLSKDKDRGWLYKRPIPAGADLSGQKHFVRVLGTHKLEEAYERWPEKNVEFEALFGRGIETLSRAKAFEKYKDKDLRRERYWSAVARFIQAEKKMHKGRLPEPEANRETGTVLATGTYPTSHAFVHVRTRFKDWARANDTDALTLYEMGDKREGNEKLFFLGLIGAYYATIEADKLGVTSDSPASE